MKVYLASEEGKIEEILIMRILINLSLFCHFVFKRHVIAFELLNFVLIFLFCTAN